MQRLSSLFGRLAPLLGFRGSRQYWEMRYKLGGHSGEGSRGVNAQYKAGVLNEFLRTHAPSSVIEFGCGDGYQLSLLDLPPYVGVDVSPTIVERCRAMYAGDPTKRFLLLDDYRDESADLSMSIDVIFHLVEDSVYDAYLDRLFAAGRRFVIVYSTSGDMVATGTSHVRHRDVAGDIARRFPGFARMTQDEAGVPPPVRFDRGLPTVFLMYERRPATT